MGGTDPHEVLQRIEARFDALTARYLVPSERTFRRVLQDLDGDALDAATCGWVADVVKGAAAPPARMRLKRSIST
jgi:hypothetical protein